jgi:hypothetical protein
LLLHLLHRRDHLLLGHRLLLLLNRLLLLLLQDRLLLLRDRLLLLLLLLLRDRWLLVGRWLRTQSVCWLADGRLLHFRIVGVVDANRCRQPRGKE